MPEPKSNFNLQELLGKELSVVDDIIKNKDAHIKRIQIPKKDGTKRNIIAPDGDLKYIQKSIYWKILKRYRAHDAAHGFVSKRGISTNAGLHVGAMSMGKIDIKKFFDSISTDHLRNCLFGNKLICKYCKNYEKMMCGQCDPSLYRNKNTKYPYRCEEIKAVLIPNYCQETGYQSLFLRVIELCTYNGFAAQGFPTSPMIANIVMRGFDKSMSDHCKNKNIVYSRYADDMAFSSKIVGKDELMNAVKKKAYRLLWAYKFKPNIEKTTWKSSAGRMKICGVVVNKKKSIQRSVLHKFRAKVHHAIVKFADKTTRSRIRQLKGWASYLMSIDKDKGLKYMNQLLAFENQKFSK